MPPLCHLAHSPEVQLKAPVAGTESGNRCTSRKIQAKLPPASHSYWREVRQASLHFTSRDLAKV
jgi:hypothetical protein